MNNLNKLKKCLYDNRTLGANMRYYIPHIWNKFGHQGVTCDEFKMQVNPYLFYYDAINHISEHRSERNSEIARSYMYSSMIRTNVSFDHDDSGKLEMKNSDAMKETGTFVKMLAYLPTLKLFGIDTIYLLPIMQTSKYEKKGELGSVYGVVDFFQLETDLFDPITGDLMTIDEQFQAFVEAAHLYGMNVVLDIIPRTNSVNSKLIVTKPEWFYWIDTKDMKNYVAPKVPTLDSTVAIDESNITDVYASADVRRHIKLFREAPNRRFPEKWTQFVRAYEANPEAELLPLIEKEFQMRIAPAFSDVINDVQPPWTDVTFFRMYLDEPAILKTKGINIDSNVPYMLFDTIKSNLFPGKIANKELWDKLANILPYYIEKFDIDGARIDMGHALPTELNKRIISEARKIKQAFYLIGEVLATDVKSIQKAKDTGYDLAIGDGFYHTHRFKAKKTRDFYYNAASLPLLIFAAGETHDSPRLLAREGGFATLQFVSILNLFAYNCVPFLNSGQELLELQPMNTGVDCNDTSAEVLNISDPYYKKLALFDYFQFHYQNVKTDFLTTLIDANKIRQKFIKQLTTRNSVTYLYYPDKEKIGLSYENGKQRLFIFANASLTETFNFAHDFKNHEVIFTTGDRSSILQPLDIRIILEDK